MAAAATVGLLGELRSARLWEAAFNSASIGMALVGLDGRWLRVNPALCQIVGYSEEELLAKTLQEITGPEDIGADTALLRKLIAGETTHCDLQKRYLRNDGKVVRIDLSMALARDGNGAPEVIVAQIRDITALKDVETALNETLRAQERLLSEFNVAHSELRKLKEGLLTMCAWTKRIQHEGKWMTVDQFLSEHLQIQVTHGISEEAYDRLMAEIERTIAAPEAGG